MKVSIYNFGEPLVERGSNVMFVLPMNQTLAAMILANDGRINFRFSQVSVKSKAVSISDDVLVGQIKKNGIRGT